MRRNSEFKNDYHVRCLYIFSIHLIYMKYSMICFRYLIQQSIFKTIYSCSYQVFLFALLYTVPSQFSRRICICSVFSVVSLVAFVTCFARCFVVCFVLTLAVGTYQMGVILIQNVPLFYESDSGKIKLQIESQNTLEDISSTV